VGTEGSFEKSNNGWEKVRIAPFAFPSNRESHITFLGKLKPLVDSEYSFEDTLKGFERIMTGHATGKVVIKIDPSIESYTPN
jgi:Zinc-binding dehydrogenase